jgi:Cu+-exporting ATPase
LKALKSKEFDLLNIKTLLKNSNHPLSKSLYEFIEANDEYFPVENFQEISGKGYEASVRGNVYKIGSARYNNQESKTLKPQFISVKTMNF